jgi:hypothetical protein
MKHRGYLIRTYTDPITGKHNHNSPDNKRMLYGWDEDDLTNDGWTIFTSDQYEKLKSLL